MNLKVKVKKRDHNLSDRFYLKDILVKEITISKKSLADFSKTKQSFPDF